MGFHQPTYNLDVNIYRYTSPLPGPPDVTCKGNLSPGRFVSIVQANQTFYPIESFVVWMLLRVPRLTDIRDGQDVPNHYDTVEVPAGTGRYYTVVYVDDVAKGFWNEHRFAYLNRADVDWPEPYP